ncbi:probable membrane-associated kinase regulator 2 [Macadamia integrifolia]|uniref:probable membrane-associated kinase regulator 2 n=1 Tax=Macadamia integrifolia TaxID=60698 RepID=UPI001C52F5BB|nr:probable membrane-associated kinase regulator 2 [Macadamia integrifolia]
MEAFSLLKYWRGGGVTGNNARTVPGTTTIAETVQQPVVETDDEEDEEGSFFDLEFAVPDDEEDCEGGDDNESESGVDEEDDGDSSTGTDGEKEFNFRVSSESSGGRTDPNLSLSPSDDLFFKGRLVPFEPSSLDFNSSEPNSKSQFPVSLLKSATKFRVFTLGLRKPKLTSSEKTESNAAAEATPKEDQPPQTQQQQQGKFLTVKFKVEGVPIVSLLSRDNSSRSSRNKLHQKNSDETPTDDKKFSKDVVQKYLKMIKPLYVKVSRRYGEKLKFSGQLSLGSGKAAPAPDPAPAPTTTPVSSPQTTKSNQGEAEETEAPHCIVRSQKQGTLPAGLRVVCKHLGKSRSASSAVAAAPPTLPSQSSRRDDSLLQQQDGIQGAILHCKRSFNASGDSETSMLSRCVSDPSHEKLISSCRNSSDLSNEKCSYRISSEEGSVTHARI